MVPKPTTALLIIHGCPSQQHQVVDAALRVALAPKALVISFTNPAPNVEQPVWVNVEDSFCSDEEGEYATRLHDTVIHALNTCQLQAVEVRIYNLHRTAQHQQVVAVLKQQRSVGALR